LKGYEAKITRVRPGEPAGRVGGEKGHAEKRRGERPRVRSRKGQNERRAEMGSVKFVTEKVKKERALKQGGNSK